MSTSAEISVPIVAFPPFKLRSSMIDKDPLIWNHMLEVYIALFQSFVIALQENKPLGLASKTKQQLDSFMKIYLSEVSDESSKIFSLGAINPDIVRNQSILKLTVFLFLKEYGLSDLELSGASAWDFCKVYVKLAAENISTNQSFISMAIVRKMIGDKGGQGQRLLMKSVQDHLVNQVAEKRFNMRDLEILYLLLGQKMQTNGNKGNGKNGRSHRDKQRKDARHSKASDGFAETFVDQYWIKLIEKLYNNGNSIHSKQCCQLMVLSLAGLSSGEISALISKKLRLSRIKNMVDKYPLLSKVVLSKKFQDMKPGLEQEIEHLKKKNNNNNSVTDARNIFTPPDEEKYFSKQKIEEVAEVFPQLSSAQIKTLLVDNKGDVSKAVSMLLEKPEHIEGIKEYKAIPKNVVEFRPNKDLVAKFRFGKKEKLQDALSPDKEMREEIKKRSLEQVLRMMYESDEDEPDDTYVDQELTEGSGGKNEKNKKQREKQLALDMKLFRIYKQDPELFSTHSRHTNYRRELKKEFGWVDEQLEGWARMLERNTHKYRMLEQQQIESGGSLNPGGKQQTRYRRPADEEERENEIDESRHRWKNRKQGDKSGEKFINKKKNVSAKKNENGSKNDSKNKNGENGPGLRKKQRDKAKNKAKRGNHNRKSGHDKKMSKLGQ